MFETIFPKIEVSSIQLSTKDDGVTLISVILSLQETIDANLNGTWFTEMDILDAFEIEIYQFLNDEQGFSRYLNPSREKVGFSPIEAISVAESHQPTWQSIIDLNDGDGNFSFFDMEHRDQWSD